MSATGILYKLLYILLHNLFTAFLFFSNLSLALYQRFLDYYHMTTTPAGEVLYIKSHLINLTKIPNHVTFLLGPEEPSHQDLTNFIVWCVISGISFITLYDHEGVLKKMEDKIKEAVEKRKPRGFHVLWHNSSGSYKNGFTGKKVHVKTLSFEDGRQRIAQVAKELVCANSVKLQTNVITDLLHKRFEFPEPELGIYCGRSFCIYAYPPWEMKFTEFHNLVSHHKLSLCTFIDFLERYSYCGQNFGK